MKLKLFAFILIFGVTFVACKSSHNTYSSKNEFNSKVFAKNKSFKVFAKNSNSSYEDLENKSGRTKKSYTSSEISNGLNKTNQQVKRATVSILTDTIVVQFSKRDNPYPLYIENEEINPYTKEIYFREESTNKQEYLYNKEAKDEPITTDPKVEGLGLTGMITGILGLFIAGIPLGILSVVFGAISLGKINKKPERFKGKGFAIAALVLGILSIIGGLIVVAAM